MRVQKPGTKARCVAAGVAAAAAAALVVSFGALMQKADWAPPVGVDCEMDRSSCSLDLLGMHFIETFLGETWVSGSTELNQESNLPTGDDIQKALALLPPHMKSTLLDCLSKHNFPFVVSGEEKSPRNLCIEHLELLFGWFSASRRRLVDTTSQAFTHVSAPSPAPALAFAPAPSPVVYPPIYAPVPSPISAPVSSPIYSGQSPVDSPDQIFQPVPDSESPQIPPDPALILPSKNNDNSMRTMIIAVVLTATVSVLFTSFLFYCYNRCHGNKVYSGAYRDDRPLLLLSSSNFSFGSSPRSFDWRNSTNMGNIVTQSLKREPSHNGQISSLPSDNERVSSLDINSAGAPSSEAVPRISSFSIEPSATTVTPIVTPAQRPPPPPVMPPPMRCPAAPAPPNLPLPPPPNLPLPPPPNFKPGLRPPPPPKGSFPPRPPQSSLSPGRVASPLRPSHTESVHCGQSTVDNIQKTKLKPFFWDKVLASPDQSMVWHQISSGSFQFNEEMIETLFGYSADKLKVVDKKKPATSDSSPQHVHILDSKKSQNLAILLRALNVTKEEICDALMEGNELPTELLQTLIKMAPTTDEELKLRLYAGETSNLGPAEQFLKALVDIPFAFQRFDALLYKSSFKEDISSIKKDLATIEAACQELKGSRLFKKLLEAVVKIGNRMNDGTNRGGAQAFKLDTLLKLSDVKGTDGKTTLLHFVVQEIIRFEGMRAEREAKGRSVSCLTTISVINPDDILDGSPCETGDHYCRLGLQVVSGLTNELENVKNAALLDADIIISMVDSLGKGLVKTKEFLNNMRSMGEDNGFSNSLENFLERAEVDVALLRENQKRIRLLVKSTTDFFHGNAGKDEGLHLFVIVRDFLGMLDKTCKEVGQVPRRAQKTPVNRETSVVPPFPGPKQLPFPSTRERHLDSSSSDDESP